MLTFTLTQHKQVSQYLLLIQVKLMQLELSQSLTLAQSSPAMGVGHWGTCLLDLQLFNFSFYQFRVQNRTNFEIGPYAVTYSTYAEKKYTGLYLSHCILHEFQIVFLCVTLKFFSLSFVALLAPNPCDATACNSVSIKKYGENQS